MSKRKYTQEIFQVRRVNRQWWIVKFAPNLIAFEKIEIARTQTQANQYADDYVENYYLDLYLKQQQESSS